MAVTGFDSNEAQLLLPRVNKPGQVENDLQSEMGNPIGAGLGPPRIYPKVWDGEPFVIEERVVEREMVVQLLLDRGADVHAHGSLGTALHAAA